MLKIMLYSADWRLAAPKQQAIWIVSPPGLMDWPSSPPKSTCSRISMTMMSGCIRGLPWIRTICWVWIWATRMVGDILKWTGKWDHSNARIARRNSCKYILRLNIQEIDISTWAANKVSFEELSLKIVFFFFTRRFTIDFRSYNHRAAPLCHALVMYMVEHDLWILGQS